MPTGICNCGCGGIGNCLGTYPTIFQCGPCDDVGSIVSGAHLSVLDGQFCERRLENNAGLLQAYITGSGQYQITFTNEPSPSLSTFSVVAGAEFGNLVAINADGKMRQLDFPNTPGLYLSTNAGGQLVAGALPAQAVPDPLTITTLNATTVNTGALNATGAVTLTGLGSGTVTQIIGLDGSGNLIIGTGSSGIQSAMFFESPTGASTLVPNSAVVAGGFLVIGNLLFDSGGSIASVQDSQTVKVDVAGTYQVQWMGQIDVITAPRTGMTIMLVVNGTVVNNGNCYPLGPILTSSSGNRTMSVTGMEVRGLLVNDTVKLQLSSASGTPLTTYQVRLVLTKIG